jgi:hypothetical protein
MPAPPPPAKPDIDIIKMYDVTRGDFVVTFERSEQVIIEIRGEDMTEPTADGRGIRICIGDVEVPLDWFRQSLNMTMPFLTGEEK